MEAAVTDRKDNGPFKSMEDFCSRLDSRTVNKKILESLVKCGAFDWDGRHRAALFAAIESAMGAAASIQKDRASGQVSLFGSMEDLAPAPSVNGSETDVDRWLRAEQLAHEKELLGFYVTGHPLDDYRGSLESSSYGSISGARAMNEPGSLRLAGLITSLEKKFTKKDNRPFGIMTLEDDSGTLELTAWDESFSKHELLLKAGSVISCNARITQRDGEIRAIASDFKPLTAKPSKKPLRLRIEHKRLTEGDLLAISAAILKHPGKRTLVLEIVMTSGTTIPLQLGPQFSIGNDQSLRNDLEPWLARR